MNRGDRSRRRGGLLTRLARRTRRGFLRDAAWLTASLAVPRVAWSAAEKSASGSPRVPPADPILTDLLAIAPILVPADATPGMGGDDVRAWYDVQRAAEPAEFAKVPAAMAAVDEAVEAVTHRKVRFASLAPTEREAVIAKIFARTHDDATASYWVRHVALPMMAFFYASPRGFSVVGYGAYNGTALAGDVTSYVGPAHMPGEAAAAAAAPTPPAERHP